MLVLVTFSPMQLYAFDPGGLTKDTQMDYFVPRGSDKTQEPDKKLTEQILEPPPKTTPEQDSAINWWLWGGVGLLAVAGGVAALVIGGSKDRGSPNPGGGGTGTTTVTGSW
jgi:hypothetical protein